MGTFRQDTLYYIEQSYLSPQCNLLTLCHHSNTEFYVIAYMQLNFFIDNNLHCFDFQEPSPNNNEKRITIMLIGVVIIFLFCNVPMGCHLLYYHFNEPITVVEDNVSKSELKSYSGWVNLKETSSISSIDLSLKDKQSNSSIILLMRKTFAQFQMIPHVLKFFPRIFIFLNLIQQFSRKRT